MVRNKNIPNHLVGCETDIVLTIVGFEIFFKKFILELLPIIFLLKIRY